MQPTFICDAHVEVVAGGQEGRSTTIRDAGWVSAVVALLAVLTYLSGLRVPETWPEVVLADAIFVGSVAVFVYSVETYLASKGHRTLFQESPAAALVVVAFALGLIGAGLAERASSSDDPPAARVLLVYERQIRKVLDPLVRANAQAFVVREPAGNPDLYAQSARELGREYNQASEVLAGIDPPRQGDQLPHSRLAAALASVGAAYLRLAAAVADAGGKAKVENARARVGDAGELLLLAEEELGDRGFQVLLSPRDASPANPSH